MQVRLSRRKLLGLGVGLVGVSRGQAPLEPQGVFPIGVASGDPSPDGVVLWTRVAPEAFRPGEPIVVEACESPDFLEPQGGLIETGFGPETDYTVRADLDGQLEPGRGYFYRFIYRGVTSPIGRTRTLHPPGTMPERLRLGLITCQEFGGGYYGALAHLAREELDAVIHLGDFIYEYSGDPRYRRERFLGRAFRLPSGSYLAVNLADYRALYRAYRSDPFLQQALAAHPWVFLWDDHEFANDTYWDPTTHAPGAPDHPFQGQPERLKKLRLEANQAWTEYVPARVVYDPMANEPHRQMSQYRRLAFGDLLELFVTDTRSYRSPHPCGEGGFGQRQFATCSAQMSPSQTMLGAEQYRWLAENLMQSPAKWRGLTSAVMFSPLRSGDLTLNTDGWDGYAAERQALLNAWARAGVHNLVVLSGDLHSALASQVSPTFKPGEPWLGAEFMAPSLTSPGPAETLRRLAFWPGNAFLEQANPHLNFFDGDINGYAVLEVTPEAVRYELYWVDKTQNRPDAPKRLARKLRYRPGRGLEAG